MNDLQQTVFYNTYSRWDSKTGRREAWEETTDRVVGWMRDHMERNYEAGDTVPWPELRNAMLNMEVLPSMRLVQMAGPALDRCHVGAYNCAYLPLKDWQCFGELLYVLMQGTGVGFSVEQCYVDMFPQIRYQSGASFNHVILDTTEGWCQALTTGLTAWANGDDVVFDYSLIRPYGAPLATKGGKASGPEPLKQLLEFARKMMLKHQGRKLSSLNLHDLACFCGSIVQVGGVRRSAEISLSDLDDAKMSLAKQGQFWLKAPERSMANNSAVYTHKPDLRRFVNEWLTMIENGSGERGLFNRGGLAKQIPARREMRDDYGLNPCGEIILRPFQFCNLSIAVARPTDDTANLARKVRLASLWGTMQSTLTKFNPMLRSEWRENCEEERLLGVDITGQMDNALLRSETNRASVYTQLKSEAVRANEYWADRFGIPRSAAVTCVKPSGNSSQLLNVSSGIHPRFAPYYVRRIRIGASSPVAQFLIDSGVPVFPEVGQDPKAPSVWVFEFPVKSPIGAVCRKDQSALQQLMQWLVCKQYYTEHNPSCTVYVKEHEWLDVASWVYKNWDSIGGLSFLPYDGGVYSLAPYEAIEPYDYQQRLNNWPKLDWSLLAKYETADNTELNREFACSGDRCEL